MGFLDSLKKAANTEIQPGDETTEAQNPRNALARLYNESIRPVLPEAIQPPEAPLMTVADEQRWKQELPEQMGMGSMGTIGKVADTARGVSQMAGQAGMNAAEQLAAATPSMYGKVVVRDTPIRPAFEKLQKLLSNK